MVRFILIFMSILFVSCEKNKPRRPIMHKTKTHYKVSVERNKRILTEEMAIIDSLIKMDSLNMYISSSNGFLFTKINENNIDNGRFPQKGDTVFFRYSVFKLDKTPIYTNFTKSYVVEKQNTLFYGLQKLIKLMRVNESVRAFFPSSLAYSFHGDEKDIGINVPLKVEIEMLNIKINKKNEK